MVAISTVRADVFSAISALLIANKPTYTYDSATYTYDTVATFPESNSSFPCIVLNPASVKIMLLNLDGSGEDYSIEVELEFYAKGSHGKKAIDTALDQVMQTFITNISTFNTTNSLLPMEDYLEESNIDIFESNKQIINTAGLRVRFKLK